MINVINAARQVRTRHRGVRVFSKGVLRRNGGNFLKEGPKKQKSNLGRAGQRNHSGLAMLEKSVFFGGQQGWG